MRERTVEIKVESDIVVARCTGRELAGRLGFGSSDQARLATAISELARNVIQYAGCGVCLFFDESADHTARIRVIVEDHGPGIAEVEKAMTDGFTTSRGLGAALPETRSLVSDFDLESEPGHTKITIVISRVRKVDGKNPAMGEG
jgi:serine/threonine-protein kinase RsbT